MENQYRRRRERGSIRSGKFELGYTLDGNGPPLLIVGSHVYYDRVFSAALRQKRRLYLVDHRAFARATEAASVEDFAFEAVIADIEITRRHFGLDRFAIVGHSGHGYMALEYARRYPGHVSHVVLAGTGPNQGPALAALADQRFETQASSFRKSVFAANMALLGDDIAAAPDQRFKHLLIRLGARSWYRPDFDARPLWDGVTVHDLGFDHLWGEVFRDYDMAAAAAGVSAPVLLALGRHDYLVAPPESWQPFLAAFRKVRVTLFERSGHTMPLEEPVAFDRVLLDFLKT